MRVLGWNGKVRCNGCMIEVQQWVWTFNGNISASKLLTKSYHWHALVHLVGWTDVSPKYISSQWPANLCQVTPAILDRWTAKVATKVRRPEVRMMNAVHRESLIFRGSLSGIRMVGSTYGSSFRRLTWKPISRSPTFSLCNKTDWWHMERWNCCQKCSPFRTPSE